MAYLEELLPEFRKGTKIRCMDWKKDEYICIKDGKVVNEKGSYLNSFYYGYLKSDNWEFYQESNPDWDYIIKNKCLCLFWNNDETDIDILKYKYTDGFLADCGNIWENCRPVCKNEVTFYEDRKDE